MASMLVQSEPLPSCDFQFLETLWFQISGTLCNLRCSHCFISCAPDNHTLEMMETDRVLTYLRQAKRHGVKEIYYTGGEPLIHRDFFHILETTLQDFPTSMLTNGLLITKSQADRLAQIAQGSRYSLEIRVSLDHFEQERNDAVRGPGTFQKVLAAYQLLYGRGLLPILTVTEIRDYLAPRESQRDDFESYVQLLRSRGIERPRIKVIPIFEMGMLPMPSRSKRVTPEMLQDFDHGLLQCSSSRIVAQDGIYACPILVGKEKARMGDSLEESMVPCSLYHTACHTCYVTGMTCKNF